MISKWVSLICLVFFLVSSMIGTISGVYATIGAVCCLVAVIFVEVLTHKHKAWMKMMEDRLQETENRIVTLSNVDRMKTMSLGKNR